MTYASTVLADTPIAFWRLNEAAGATTAVDSSGNARNATVNATMGGTGIVAGDTGATSMQAGSSADTGMGATANAVYNFGTSSPLTIEFWMKGSVSGSEKILYSSGGANGRVDTTPAGKIAFLDANGAVTTGGTTVTNGAPHHIVCVRAPSTGLVSIYVDGVLDNTPAASTGAFGDSTHNTYFGFEIAAPTFGFTGSIQDAAIYNTALSSGRVAAHYAAGSSAGGSLVASQNLGDCIAASATSATVSATASGGAGAITYAWHKSPTYNFTPGSGTLVAGQTGATATFAGLVPGVDAWVVCVISDGTTTVTTFHRLLSISGLAPLRVGYIGDSTTDKAQTTCMINSTQAALDRHAKTYLESRQGNRKVTVVNQGVSGTSSGDWLAGSSNTNAALAAFSAAGMVAGDFVCLRLGVNDAQAHVAQATYTSNMTSLIGALTAAGYKVQLDFPTWREPGVFIENTATTFDESTTPYLLTWWSVLAGMANGTSIFVGDVVSARNWAATPTLYINRSTTYPGGIHPIVDGAIEMGVNSAEALIGNLGLGSTVYPLASQVLVGITFGPTSNLMGNVVLPTAPQVVQGVNFGPNGLTSGTASAGGVTPQPPGTRTISINVTDRLGVPMANTSFQWAWFDQPRPQLLAQPTDQGPLVTTNSLGVLTLSVHTALGTNGVGSLVLSSTDGTVAQFPPAIEFFGPVALQ